MSTRRPAVKAIIFDVGGVCVLSPMLAIRSYEKRHHIPSGYINHAIVHTSPNGAWHKLERGEIPLDTNFFLHFTSDLTNPSIWKHFHASRGLTPASLAPPAIDGEYLFWEMMKTSRTFDPYFITAIQRLKEIGGYKLAALTNDYQFPKDHPYSDSRELRSLFDVYVSSSESGVRKPERGIYELVLKKLGLEKAEEAVFLDDIGMNLKAARAVGLRTIKVGLDETWRAVRELEDLTGERLLPPGDPPIVAALGQDRARL